MDTYQQKKQQRAGEPEPRQATPPRTNVLLRHQLRQSNYEQGKARLSTDAVMKKAVAPKSARDEVSVARAGFGGTASSLPAGDRIGAALGADLSNVQMHTGPAATEACDRLGAEAYTFGNQMAFRDSSPSLALQAHEATHAVQQGQASAAVQTKSAASGGVEALESEADAVADAVTSGRTVEVGTGGPVSVQTKKDRVPGEGTPYTIDSYRQDLLNTLNFFCDHHRSAASQLKNTLGMKSFGLKDALAIIAQKGIGVALGYVPGAGKVLKGLWNAGVAIYQKAASTAKEQSARTFFQQVVDNINDVSSTGLTKLVTEYTGSYEEELAKTSGKAQQTYMDDVRRLNHQGFQKIPSAKTVEAGLYEVYLSGRQKSDGFLGFGNMKGRVEVTYEIVNAYSGSATYKLQSGTVRDSGSDSAVAARLTQLHNGSVDVHTMQCPKSRRFYVRGVGYQSVHYDRNNNLTSTVPGEVTEHVKFVKAMGTRFPTVALA